jgi:hypothetical protein
MVWFSNSKYYESWRVVQNMFVCSHVRPIGLNLKYSLQRYIFQSCYEEVRKLQKRQLNYKLFF